MYDIRMAVEVGVQKISNWDVALQAELDYRQRGKGLDTHDEDAVKRVVSAIVARHMKDANDLVESADVGCFPN